MTKKSLLAKVLCLVLIIAMLSVCFMACKKPATDDTDKPSDDITPTTTAAEVVDLIMDGLNNACDGKTLSDLDINAGLKVTVNDSVYDIDLNAALDLAENVKDRENATTTRNTMASLVIKKGDDAVLSALYIDNDASALSDEQKYSGNKAYIQYGVGTNKTNLAVTAPYVKDTMLAQNGYVYDAEINETITDGFDTVADALKMVFAIIGKNPTINADKTACSVDIPLAEILASDEVSGILGGIDEAGYIDRVGIDLALGDLATILPAISVKISASLSNNVLTGLAISLDVAKKDITIKHTGDNGNLLELKMANDLAVKLELDYAIGEASFDGMFNDTYTEYFGTPVADFINCSALNIEVAGKLSLSADLNQSINLDENGNKIVLAATAGEYDAYISMGIDPTKLLGKVFTAKAYQYYKDGETKVYIGTKANTTYDEAAFTGMSEAEKTANVKTQDVASVSNIIAAVVDALDFANIVIKSNAFTALDIQVEVLHDTNQINIKSLNLGILTTVKGDPENTILGMIGSLSALNGTVGITSVTSILEGVLKTQTEIEVSKPEATAVAEEEAIDADTAAILATVKEYLMPLQIKIDENGLSVKYNLALKSENTDVPADSYTTNIAAEIKLSNGNSYVQVTASQVKADGVTYLFPANTFKLSGIKVSYGTASADKTTMD